jgi:hypothetical protein
MQQEVGLAEGVGAAPKRVDRTARHDSEAREERVEAQRLVANERTRPQRHARERQPGPARAA